MVLANPNDTLTSMEIDMRKLECSGLYIAPLSVDLEVPKAATREDVEKAIIYQFLLERDKLLPKHLPEHVIIRFGYKYDGVEYTVKMDGKGNILP